MATPFHYLDDSSLLPRLVSQLYENGYVPSFTASQLTGEGDFRHKTRVASHKGTKFTAEPLELDSYLRTAKAEPHYGIGVSTPTTRRTDLLLVGLDCDIPEHVDPTIQQVLASVIQKPCPTRIGSKGCAMFVTIKSDYDKEWLKERKLATKDITGPPLPDPLNPNVKGAISRLECTLFSQMQHLVLPPSRYPQPVSPDDDREFTDKFYRWVAFPSINPAKQLELSLFDTPIDQLPRITEGRLFELSLHVRDPDNAIRAFITGPAWQGAGDGDYRSRIGRAIHRYVFDGFSDDFIRKRIVEIAHDHLAADPNPEWGDDDERLLEDIAGWIQGSRAKKAEERPKSTPQQSARKQVTDDRAAADYLSSKYPYDDVYAFDGELFCWTSAGWLRLTFEKLFNEVYDAMPMLGYNHLNNACKMWLRRHSRPAPPANPSCILFPEGMLDVATMQLREPRKEDFNPHMMQADFNPDMETPVYLAHMANMVRPPMELLIPEDQHEEVQRLNLNLFEEFMGYSMVRNYRFQKMLFVIGPPNAGKGTMWRFIGRHFPNKTVTYVGFEDLGEPNIRLNMVGGLLNIGSEVGRKDRSIDDILNKITANEPVTVWRMNVSREQVTLASRLIFDGNLPPNSSDGTGAFARRAMIMMVSGLPEGVKPMNSDDYDAMMAQEAPGILARWAMAYKRLLARGRFDEPDYMAKQTEEIRIESNPTLQWISECCGPSDKPMASSDLYASFREWANFHGYTRPPADNVWGKIMKQNGYPVHITKVGGINVRTRYAKLLDADAMASLKTLATI